MNCVGYPNSVARVLMSYLSAGLSLAVNGESGSIGLDRLARPRPWRRVHARVVFVWWLFGNRVSGT